MVEGQITPWLEKKNEFYKRMQEAKVGCTLVDNEDFTSEPLHPITPTNANAFISEISTSNDPRQELLAELGIAGRTVNVVPPQQNQERKIVNEYRITVHSSEMQLVNVTDIRNGGFNSSIE